MVIFSYLLCKFNTSARIIDLCHVNISRKSFVAEIANLQCHWRSNKFRSSSLISRTTLTKFISPVITSVVPLRVYYRRLTRACDNHRAMIMMLCNAYIWTGKFIRWISGIKSYPKVPWQPAPPRILPAGWHVRTGRAPTENDGAVVCKWHSPMKLASLARKVNLKSES